MLPKTVERRTKAYRGTALGDENVLLEPCLGPDQRAGEAEIRNLTRARFGEELKFFPNSSHRQSPRLTRLREEGRNQPQFHQRRKRDGWSGCDRSPTAKIRSRQLNSLGFMSLRDRATQDPLFLVEPKKLVRRFWQRLAADFRRRAQMTWPR
jgi:hypothetical protein